MLVEKIEAICKQVKPDYIFEYEESAMLNVKADSYARGDKFVYVEEFTKGRYIVDGYKKKKVTQVQIWFCRLSLERNEDDEIVRNELHNNAITREQIRNQIESEITLPFMTEFEKQIHEIDTWQFYTPLPRFDANEVSIMLQFEYKNDIC